VDRGAFSPPGLAVKCKSLSGWLWNVSMVSSEQNMVLPISSARLRIRRFDREDVGAFASFMADAHSTEFLSFGEDQKSRKEAAELLDATINSYDSQEPMMAYAVEVSATREFVGFCGLTPRGEGSVEIMYAVMPRARGNGYATEVAATLAQYAVSSLGYRRVVAPISPEHRISMAVATKAGFKDWGVGRNAGSTEMVRLFVYERAALTSPETG